MKNLKRILSFFIVMGFMFVMFGFRVGVKAATVEREVTYTVTGKTSCSASGYTQGTTASYTQTYSTKCQATGGNSLSMTITFKTACTLKNITLSVHSNKSGGKGSLDVKLNGSSIWSIANSTFDSASWNGEFINTYVPKAKSFNTAIANNDVLTFNIAATENSLFCESYTLTYEAEAGDPTVTITSPASSNILMPNTLQLESSYFDIATPSPDTWNSSNTSAATVSSTGLVTPVAMGTTNITRTVNGTVSNTIALKIWPSNASNISVATALAIAEFSGNANSAFKYTSTGTVSNVIDSSNFTLFDGNDSIRVYKTNHGVRANDSIVVNGNLKNHNNSNLQFASPTITGYSVSFDSNGGTPAYAALTNLTGGSKISSPGTPTKDGYNFVGWYNGETPWDFENDKVNTFITLTAHWISNGVDEAINTQISNINAYMSLAYKYTFGSSPATNEYIKVISSSQLSSGDTVIIVSKAKDGKYYAVTNSIASKTAARSGELTIENDVITSEISSNFVWTVNGNEKDGWSLRNGEKYIDNGNSTDMALGDAEVREFHLFAQGNNSYFLNNGTRAIYDNGTGFKNYAISNLGSSNYATEIYVFVKQASVNNTYRDVDFRLRIAVGDGVASVLSGLSLEGKWGIEVTAGDKTVKYECDEDYMQSIDGYKYVVVDLGDMLNGHHDKITTNFTARAYVEYNGNYYYSTKTRTYSIKSMLDNYYGEPATTSIVEGLVQALEGYGYTFSNE